LQRLSFSEFETRAEAFDRAVDASADVDRFCSRAAWVASFQRAFGAQREPCVFEAGGSFAALARTTWPGGRRGLEALENMWGFACPLVGPGATALLAELMAPGGALAGELLWLTGLPPDRERLRALLPRGHSGRVVGRTERCVATLDGGVEGFLMRRSRAFRRNLRSARRRVAAHGIRFERIEVQPDAVPALYARVLAIERASWKARTGNGADRGPMAEFYFAMWPRLAAQGALRLLLALDQEGRDVGYLHGGMLDRRFRGLQFSFAAELAPLGLGNVLQIEAIEWLCAAGCERYDLGSRSGYKERWAEGLEASVGLLVLPPALA
jgi:CelD/BcsL family acetyltransferase involved in cellulose biosynthesis